MMSLLGARLYVGYRMATRKKVMALVMLKGWG